MKKYTALAQTRYMGFVTLGLVAFIALADPKMAPALTISATAIGSDTPSTAPSNVSVPNVDFLITSNPVCTPTLCTTGDGINEGTTWTFDFQRDRKFPAFPAVPILSTAPRLISVRLTLTLTPKDPVISTDQARIEGLPPLFELRAFVAAGLLRVGEKSTIQLDLLTGCTPTTSPQQVCLQRGQNSVEAVQSYTANDIFNIFESNGGKIPMSYGDDAIVSFTRLDLQDSDVPAVCSENEVQVTGNEFIVLPDVHVTLPSVITENEQCKITFSTEAATSESAPQLLQLAYAFFFDPNEIPTPLKCTSLDGPVFTQVGFDETHTFISVVKNTLAFHGPKVLAPCVKSVFGGQFRLQRHCLVLECLTK
jgi:hypothetical protein